MRILTVGNMYPPYHLGGYELVWQGAVRALRAAGHDVRVLTTGDLLGRAPGAPEDPEVHRELRWYWRDHEFPRLPLRARLALERDNRAILERHLAGHRPDVVSWWSMGGMSLALIEQVRRAGLPASGWVADEWLGYGPVVDQWQHLWGRRATRGLPARLAERLTGVPTRVDFDHAARWLFCSDYTRRAALRFHPLRRTGVHHLGIAADFQPVAPGPWRGRVLYAGRIDERKGVGTLIDAVAGLPDLTLRIVGDGEEAASARLRERAAPLGARVTFEPGVDRPALARVYAEADVVAFPVEWAEPWGLVPLEAMAVGRPVVATGLGGSAEYLEHERNALLYPAGEVGALQAALRRVADEPALRERFLEHGRRTAAQHTEARFVAAVVAEHEALGAATSRSSAR